MTRRNLLLLLALSCTGCGASAITLALKALAVAVDVAREVHDRHLDGGGGAVCPTPARDAGADE